MSDQKISGVFTTKFWIDLVEQSKATIPCDDVCIDEKMMVISMKKDKPKNSTLMLNTGKTLWILGIKMFKITGKSEKYPPDNDSAFIEFNEAMDTIMFYGPRNADGYLKPIASASKVELVLFDKNKMTHHLAVSKNFK